MAKTKNNTQEKQPIIVQSLTIRPLNRSVADIGTWRRAMQAADYGRRKQLYDLYDDLLIDGVLSRSINKRIEAITNAELVFRKNDQPVPEIDNLMDTPEFEYMLEEMMMSKAYGVSVLEFDFRNGFECYSIPRTHILPAKKQILINDTDETGISYADNDMVIQVGRDDDLGFILSAAQYVIYKRGGFGDWSQWAELCGIPFKIAKYNSFDENSRQILNKALAESGSAPYIVAPKETEIEIKEARGSGNGDLFNILRNACNEEILVVTLGQTMTTINGASRSQGEVHKETEESINKADRRYVQRILNNEFLKILEKRGYPVQGGWFDFTEAGETLSTLDRVKRDIELSKVIGIPKSYFYEQYSIPEPVEGDEIAGDNSRNPEESQEQKNGVEKAELSDKSFLERLSGFFVSAPRDGAMREKLTGYHPTIRLNDDDKVNGLLHRIASGEAAYWDAELFKDISTNLLLAFRRGWDMQTEFADLGIEYGYESDAYKVAMEQNLFHFSAAKTLAEIQELNVIFRQSTNFAEFAREAEKVTDLFNKQWAETEYVTALLTAQAASTYHRLKGITNIYPYWEYVTQDDDRVRPEHAKLHGLILPANDPAWSKIYPPNGWRCRCYVRPLTKAQALAKGYNLKESHARVQEYLSSAQFKKDEAQGWGVNRAEITEVFTANQQYIRKFPDKAAKYLDRVTYTDYNLPTMGKLMKEATIEMPVFEGTAEEWYADQQLTGGNALLTDYLKRKVLLTDKNFKRHTSKSRAYRVEFLEALKDTLSNPDEVWLNGYIGSNYNYYVLFKYYSNQIITVICEAVGRKYELKTWFPLADNKEVKEKYRRGLLVKGK